MQTHCITRIQAFLSKPHGIKESTVRMLSSLHVRQNVRKEIGSYQWCHKKKHNLPKAQIWHIKVRINITLLNSPSKFIKACCYTLWKICLGSTEPGSLQIAGKPPIQIPCKQTRPACNWNIITGHGHIRTQYKCSPQSEDRIKYLIIWSNESIYTHGLQCLKC